MPSPDSNPYATPREAQTSADAGTGQPMGGLKDLRTLALLSCVLYGGTALGSKLTDAFLSFASTRTSYWIHFSLGFTNIVLFLCWNYRAAWNARRIDPAQMPVSPGKAVGGYFIPLANFVIPYRAMRGIARASLGKSADGHVAAWWALVVALFLIPFYAGLFFDLNRTGSRASPLPASFDNILSILGWLLIATGISLVIRITYGQVRRGLTLIPDVR